MEAKCGTCGGKHETVLEYRECAGAKLQDESASKVMDSVAGPPIANRPSEKQVKYVMDLLRTRDWPDSYTADDIANMERRQVSKLIDALMKAVAKPDAAEIPSGWYALEKPDGSWGFWQADSPSRGRWVGFTFITQLVGSPGDYARQKVSKNIATEIIAAIKRVTPQVASADFGKQSGVCGLCASPLTNAASLERGIGPKCASKMGW